MIDNSPFPGNYNLSTVRFWNKSDMENEILISFAATASIKYKPE